MAWMKRDDERVKTFEKVREQELKYIVKRQPLGKDDQLPKEDVVAERLIGLAFSGGGIRSATTNLGIAQALSRTISAPSLAVDISAAASPPSCPSIAITRRRPVTRSSLTTRYATS